MTRCPATVNIPTSVLPPSRRVRARLRVLGWSLEHLGASRARREDRERPYSESTVRGWLATLDTGTAHPKTVKGISEALGLNPSILVSDDPTGVLKARPRRTGIGPGDFFPRPEHERVPSDLCWEGGRRLRGRLGVAAAARGTTVAGVARAVGLNPTRLRRIALRFTRRMKGQDLPLEYPHDLKILRRVGAHLGLGLYELVRPGQFGIDKLLDPRSKVDPELYAPVPEPTPRPSRNLERLPPTSFERVRRRRMEQLNINPIMLSQLMEGVARSRWERSESELLHDPRCRSVMIEALWLKGADQDRIPSAEEIRGRLVDAALVREGRWKLGRLHSLSEVVGTPVERRKLPALGWPIEQWPDELADPAPYFEQAREARRAAWAAAGLTIKPPD